MPATNYSKSTPVSSSYDLEAADSADILLLQTDDDLLLQNGVDNLLLESGVGIKPTNYAKSNPSATNYAT